MIENGADIDNAVILFDKEDILYLVQRGNNIQFGKYDKIEKMWKQWLQITKIELDTIMIPDLVNIIASY